MDFRTFSVRAARRHIERVSKSCMVLILFTWHRQEVGVTVAARNHFPTVYDGKRSQKY